MFSLSRFAQVYTFKADDLRRIAFLATNSISGGAKSHWNPNGNNVHLQELSVSESHLHTFSTSPKLYFLLLLMSSELLLRAVLWSATRASSSTEKSHTQWKSKWNIVTTKSLFCEMNWGLCFDRDVPLWMGIQQAVNLQVRRPWEELCRKVRAIHRQADAWFLHRDELETTSPISHHIIFISGIYIYIRIPGMLGKSGSNGLGFVWASFGDLVPTT